MSRTHLIYRHQISDTAFQEAARNFKQSAIQHSVQAQAWTLHNRIDLDESEAALAFLLLDSARHQQLFAASPLLSRFKVASTISCGPNKIAHGVNMEYGAGPRKAVDEGVHSEEAALSNALSLYGRDTCVELVGLTTDSSQPSTPCGKCRSLLETYAHGDPVIVSAGSDLSATVWKLSELMPRHFDSVDISSISDDERTTISVLRAAAHDGQSRGATPLSKQAVGIDCACIVADGVGYSLPRVDSLAFYPTTSLRATIAAALAAKPSRIDAVMLSSRSGLPIGEDRQLLLELANLFAQAGNLPVYLQAEGSQTLQRTTPSMLLPYAFGPKDLSLHN